MRKSGLCPPEEFPILESLDIKHAESKSSFERRARCLYNRLRRSLASGFHEEKFMVSDCDRPFRYEEFQGWFVWQTGLTSTLIGKHFYHACHEATVIDVLKEKQLRLRSEIVLILSDGKRSCLKGVWSSLNYYPNSRFGPFVFEFPLSFLEERTFMVFLRSSKERDRYFFLEQQAAQCAFGETHRVDPCGFFVNGKNGASLNSDDTYYVVSTNPLPLGSVVPKGVSHTECVSMECSGSPKHKNEARLSVLMKSLQQPKRVAPLISL
jgi:hypothetical protein